MKAEHIHILCSPIDHEPLRLEVKREADGWSRSVLVGAESGRIFQFNEGIPVFADETALSVSNRGYTGQHDRMLQLDNLGRRISLALFHGAKSRIRRECLSKLEIRDGCRVLDVSVGTGDNLRLCPPKAEYHGLDACWWMLKRCNNNFKQWRVDAELYFGLADALPFKDDTFDVVFQVGGVNCFDYKERTIAEMVRVAKPGAMILVADETGEGIGFNGWIPGSKSLFKRRSKKNDLPVDKLPSLVEEVNAETLCRGSIWCLTFRKSVIDPLQQSIYGGRMRRTPIGN